MNLASPAAVQRDSEKVSELEDALQGLSVEKTAVGEGQRRFQKRSLVAHIIAA